MIQHYVVGNDQLHLFLYELLYDLLPLLLVFPCSGLAISQS